LDSFQTISSCHKSIREGRKREGAQKKKIREKKRKLSRKQAGTRERERKRREKHKLVLVATMVIWYGMVLLLTGVLFYLWRAAVHKNDRYVATTALVALSLIITASIFLLVVPQFDLSPVSDKLLGFQASHSQFRSSSDVQTQVSTDDVEVEKTKINNDLIIVLLLELDAIKFNHEECSSSVYIAQRVADRYNREFELYAIPVDFSSLPWESILERFVTI